MNARWVILTVVGLLAETCSTGFAEQRKAGQERVNPLDGAVLVWVPGTGEACPTGKFRMGSTPQEIDSLWGATGWNANWRKLAADEEPAHEVKLDGFWVYRDKVTVGQYAKFLRATRHPAPPWIWDDLKGHADRPVVMVSWGDVAAYCQWAGAELPTEAQWEYAARGPEDRLFPWGNTWDRARCNSAEYHAERALNDTASWQAWWGPLPYTPTMVVQHLRDVESFPAGTSWCGATDMAGNVWEWCRDWYDRTFYGSAAATQSNPECADDSSGERVMRGGAWDFYAYACRATARSKYLPDHRFDHCGFRPALAG